MHLCVFDTDSKSLVANLDELFRLRSCSHVGKCSFPRLHLDVHILFDAPCHEEQGDGLCEKPDTDLIRVVASVANSPDLRPRLLKLTFESDDINVIGFPYGKNNRLLKKMELHPPLVVRPRFIKSKHPTVSVTNVRLTRTPQTDFERKAVAIVSYAYRDNTDKRPLKCETNLAVAIPSRSQVHNVVKGTTMIGNVILSEAMKLILTEGWSFVRKRWSSAGKTPETSELNIEEETFELRDNGVLWERLSNMETTARKADVNALQALCEQENRLRDQINAYRSMMGKATGVADEAKAIGILSGFERDHETLLEQICEGVQKIVGDISFSESA